MLLLLLPDSPRCSRPHRASLLWLATVLLCVRASLSAQIRCPSPLDCVGQRRHPCQPGFSDCGSCIDPFQENERGRCVSKPHHHGKVKSTKLFTNVDEEIDFIHSVIEKEVAKTKPPQQQQRPPGVVNFRMDEDGGTVTSRQKSQNTGSTASPPRLGGAGQPNTTTVKPRVEGASGRSGPKIVRTTKNDTLIVILISLAAVVGTVAVIVVGICYVKVQTESHLTEKVDYPAFKGSGASAAKVTSGSGDHTLAKSAQMYHYQHQKQQMISMGNHKPEQKTVDSEVTSDEEEVGGGFTVYECPGLAPTGEMEVKNPLFDDSSLEYQGNPK